MRKNYATWTDIITTPDPLFYYGDKVTLDPHRYPIWYGLFSLYVQSWSWDTLAKSWTYTLVYFEDAISGDSMNYINNGSMAHPEVLEKDLILFSRRVKK